jgi:hypothetical protein
MRNRSVTTLAPSIATGRSVNARACLVLVSTTAAAPSQIGAASYSRSGADTIGEASTCSAVTVRSWNSAFGLWFALA